MGILWEPEGGALLKEMWGGDFKNWREKIHENGSGDFRTRKGEGGQVYQRA